MSETSSVILRVKKFPKQDSKILKDKVKIMDLTTSKLRISALQIAQYKNIMSKTE